MKAGTHSAFGEGSHTAACTPKQGPSLLRPQHGFVLSVKSLLFHRAFIYIHFPVLCEPPLSADEKKSESCRHKFYPPTVSHPAFQLPSQTAHVCFRRRKRVHNSAFGERSHTMAHTANQGPSLPRPQCGFVLPAKYLIFRHAFIYIHFPVLCEPPLSADEKKSESCRHKFYPLTVFHPAFQLLAQMAHVRFHG